MRRPLFLTRLAGSLAAGSLLLAGCAQALPQPSPDAASDEPQPVLTVEQTGAVLDDVGQVLAAADSSGNVDGLSARLVDPALRIRVAQFRLNSRSQGSRPPTTLTTEDQIVVVAAEDAWPRTVVAVTVTPSGSTTPLLLVLRQADARSPYLLYGWVRLFPGVETPVMAAPEIGSRMLAADADGFRATPADVLTWYSDVLEKGAESQHADAFEPDLYSETLQSEIETGRESLEGIAQITLDALAVRDGVVALETADGGALVVGQVTTSTGYKKTLSGATLTLGGEAGAWLGDGNVPALASVRHDSVIAFYVPASDSQKITVLGAERALTDASKV